jgi:hypothetical protein
MVSFYDFGFIVGRENLSSMTDPLLSQCDLNIDILLTNIFGGRSVKTENVTKFLEKKYAVLSVYGEAMIQGFTEIFR